MTFEIGDGHAANVADRARRTMLGDVGPRISRWLRARTRALVSIFYSWQREDGTYSGLARNRDGVYSVVNIPEKEWAVKAELLGLLLDGDMAFDQISHEEATSLAHRYGVALEAEPKWKWDSETQQFVSLATGEPAESTPLGT